MYPDREFLMEFATGFLFGMIMLAIVAGIIDSHRPISNGYRPKHQPGHPRPPQGGTGVGRPPSRTDRLKVIIPTVCDEDWDGDGDW